VEPETFKDLYGIEEKDMDKAACGWVTVPFAVSHFTGQEQDSNCQYILHLPCPCALFLEVLTPNLMNLHTWLSFCFCSGHRFCQDQIRSVYGGRSKELKTFQRVIRNLEKG
jgi:hypothetical protein